MAAASRAGHAARFTFEVYGKVQGVFFRKYTVAEARKLEVVGWVANTPEGTVQGECQGAAANLEKMKHWLEHVGSPNSRIEKAVFSDTEPIPALEFSDFVVRHL